MVRVSPAARKSKLLSAAPNVAVIAPEEPPLSTLVVSADASTALSSPGSALPLDQVIEARLTLSELNFKSVKVRMAEGAVSSPVLPVVWGISRRGCSTGSGTSTGGGRWRGG